MASLPPSGAVPPTEQAIDPQQASLYTLQESTGRRPWLRFVLAGLFLVVVVWLLLIALLPGWRTTVSGWLDRSTGTITQQANLPPAGSRDLTSLTVSQSLTQTATATPTPHPALSLDVTLDESTAPPRWQIAYPDVARGPGLGCAYFSFRLIGADASNPALLDQVDAELVIYDGEFVFERYGPLPLQDLRGLADSQYYELPGSGPECSRHRFSEPEAYSGLEFRLSLLAGDIPVQIFRYGLTDALAFATITPTPAAATITPTPFAQARIKEAINVRSGPGTAYSIVGAARKDDVYAVTASDGTRQWWQIDYQGLIGWVYAPLVETIAVDEIAVAQAIPPLPPPLPTVAPTVTPAPPTPEPTPYFPFLLSSVGICESNQAMTYFEGQVLNADGTPLIGACVHIAYDGPRQTKCTGCDGDVNAKWGFPGRSDSTVRIYVVPCPEEGMTGSGQDAFTGFGPLVPVSPVWTYTVGESAQCKGITFTDNRFFDDGGQQIPPPAPTLAPSPNELYRFQGGGQAFTPPFILSAGQVRFRINLTGQGTYSLQLLSSIGRNIDILAGGSGAATVDKTVDIPGNGTYFVSVITDGPWTILVENP
ncbi:SH3 domain-containing protein [bacterium]|nr:SH3 domain-containing protein [bacterium]